MPVQVLFPLPQTVEHGFPNQPSALAFDPELRIMAIGTRSGAVKMYPLWPMAFEAVRTCLQLPVCWTSWVGPSLGGCGRCLDPGGG